MKKILLLIFVVIAGAVCYVWIDVNRAACKKIVPAQECPSFRIEWFYVWKYF